MYIVKNIIDFLMHMIMKFILEQVSIFYDVKKMSSIIGLTFDTYMKLKRNYMFNNMNKTLLRQYYTVQPKKIVENMNRNIKIH